jgi:hypothetical protein
MQSKRIPHYLTLHRESFKLGSDAMNIYGLRQEELATAYTAAVEAVMNELSWPGSSYASLAERIGVREDSLKKFVARHAAVIEKPDAIRRGSVFLKVHSALVVREGALDVPSDRQMSMEQRRKGYTFINAMLGTKGSEIALTNEVMFSVGRFLCFRNSTQRSRIAVSEIAFRNIGSAENPIWEFEHHFTEADASQKMAEGPVLVMGSLLYLFGDIELGEALEIIVLDRPGRDARFVSGVTFSRDRNRVPFVANVILIPAYDGDREFDPNDIRRITDSCFIEKRVMLEMAFGEDQTFGKKLINQLNIPRTLDVMRFNTDKIIKSERP